MGIYEHTFDWVSGPEGRARFAGGIRGWDERGHETYAVEMDGEVLYGEIARAFLPNQNDFNVLVVSFGYGSRENVGMPRQDGLHPRAQANDPAQQLQRVQSLLTGLIQAARHFEDRPGVLREYPHARFQGQLIFAEGWAAGAPARVMTLDVDRCPSPQAQSQRRPQRPS